MVQAMLKCVVIGDKVRQSRAYRGIQVSYERIYNVMYAQRFKEKADMLTSELKQRMGGAYSSMEDMKARLIDTTASMGAVVSLERITAGCIRMRADRITLEEKIGQVNDRHLSQKKESEASKELLQKIEDQLQEAKTTDKDEMNSALVHEKEQVSERRKRGTEDTRARMKKKSTPQTAFVVKLMISLNFTRFARVF